LYVDFLDTSGTLMAIVQSMGIADSEGNFEGARMAFCADAVSVIVGSMFGLAPVTAYIESGAGVAAGARTGITAIVCGFLFFLSIFFAPIIASIPPWATGGALIITGALMAESLGKIKWYDITHASTAFLTVLIMPLTYSIAYGLLAGIICYLILNITFTVLEYAGIPRPVFYEPEPVIVPADASDDTAKAKELPESSSDNDETDTDDKDLKPTKPVDALTEA
jgi:adenine/guanine/hypoxanthine permease